MKQLIRRVSMTLGVIAIVLIAVVLGLYMLRPQAPKPSGDQHTVGELEAYLQEVVATNHPPGLSVAVVKEEKVVYANGFGIADGPNGAMTTKGTVYHWWSMTKIPTAVAVMQLHERGMLDIDDPVSDHLPFFKVTLDGAELSTVSIRQILNHTAGLPDSTPEIMTWLHQEGDPPVDQTELIVEKFPDYAELLFTPGEKAKYSNVGYMVLGALIESVTGQKYEQYMIDNILLPAGMQNTNFRYTESMAASEAIGSQHLIDMYTPFIPIFKLGHMVREREGMRLWFDRVYNDQTPPTGLIGPVTDVALFMKAYLNEGGHVLKPETVSAMNAVLDDLSSPGESARGLGWVAHLTDDGRRYLAHGGGGPGFATIFRVYPEENLGVVVMGNDSTIDREILADVLANTAW